MTVEALRQFLAYSLVINYLILLAWFATFTFAHGWMQRLHGKWFKLSEGTFDAIHYGGMAAYKIGILLFNLVPLIVLRIMRHGG